MLVVKVRFTNRDYSGVSHVTGGTIRRTDLADIT